MLRLSADQLQWKVVKQLDDWLSRAAEVQQGDVTPGSWKKLQAAVSAAEALDPATSSHDDYVAALSRLVSAYEHLAWKR